MESREVLELLCSAAATPGHEENIAGTIQRLLSAYCDEVTMDKFFNVVGTKKPVKDSPRKTRVMICAHTDEVGLIVTGLDERGFIRFAGLGGIDRRILPGQEVLVHGKEELFGVVGAKPPHMQSHGEAGKAVRFEDMCIDTGFPFEKVRERVQVGDRITYKPVNLSLQEDVYSNKSLDNRSGVTAMIEVLKELQNIKHEAEIIAVATVQEEVGVRGAVISAYALQPDIALIIDACHGDIPDAAREDVFPLGKGPAIGIGPILNLPMSKYLIDLAREYGIPHQIDVEPGSTGTEAWATQILGYGIPTVLLSIPVKYMHTTVETLSMRDIRNTARLAALFTAKITDRLEELVCC